MFGKPSGAAFNFGNTSTPTNTPASSTTNPLGQSNPLNNNSINIGTSTPSPSVGLFSNSSNNQQNGGLFGRTANGQQSSGLFGNNASAQQNSNLFGNSSSTQQNGGLFGNTNSTQQSGGLFGNKPQQQTGGLFGTSTAATNNVANSGLFGSSNTNKTQTTGSLFDNKQGSLNIANSGTGLGLGNKTAGLFGNSSNTNNTSGLFGNNQPSGLFGNSSTSNNILMNKPITNNLGANGQPQNNGILPTSNPYGFTMSSNTTPLTTMPEPLTGTLIKENSINTEKGASNNKRSASMSSAAPKNTSSYGQSTLISKLSSRLSSGQASKAIQGVFSPSSVKPWLGEQTSKPNRPTDLKDNILGLTVIQNNSNKKIRDISNQRENLSELRKLKIDSSRSASKKLKLLSGGSHVTKSQNLDMTEGARKQNPSADTARNDFSPSSELKSYSIPKMPLNDENVNKNNSDYWCTPSPEQLRLLTSDQLSSVSNFVIGRRNHGYITYSMPVDLRKFSDNFEINLFDNIVKFRSSKTVEVYPKNTEKPPVGYGINVPAVITLENVYPIDRKTKKYITDSSRLTEFQKFAQKLRSLRDMEFISYNPFGGVWTFKVQHFSIWGLVNESDAEIDEDDDMEDILDINKLSPQSNESQLNVSAINTGNLIDEKVYEPDIEEEDFEGLEQNEILDVAKNWDEQLRLANQGRRSIFLLPTDRAENELDLLLSNFNDAKNKTREIEQERRLNTKKYNPCSFGNGHLVIGDNRSRKILITNQVLVKDELPAVLTDRTIFDNELKTTLIHSRSSNNYPCVFKKELIFKDVLQCILPTSESYKLWNFSSILFDPIQIDCPMEAKDATLKYKRRDNICNWIKDHVRDNVYQKIKVSTTPLEKIFLHLLINEIETAAKIAIDSDNSHLSILISMLGSNDPRLKALAHTQIEQWSGIGSNVEIYVAKIYKLLSGELFKGPFSLIENAEDVNWLVLVGAALHYGEVDELSLEDLIGNSMACLSDHCSGVFYLLLKLFCSTRNADQVLQEILKESNALGIDFLWHCLQALESNGMADINNPFCDQITVQYAQNLELSGHIPEALYICAHIKDDHLAKKLFESIIFSNIHHLTLDGKPLAIMSKLMVPNEVIYRSMAQYAKYRKCHQEELEYLLKSKDTRLAKEVFITKVAPSYILGNDDSKLLSLTSMLEQFDRNSTQRNDIKVYDYYIQFKKNSENSNIIKSLASELPQFYSKHQMFENVTACCNIISNNVLSAVLDLDNDSKTKEFSNLVCNMPLGQPERKYATLHFCSRT